jgi:hypothetical protein
MAPSDLCPRVIRLTAAAIALLALAAGWIVGTAALVGVVAAGSLTVANFWCLGRLAGRVRAGSRGVMIVACLRFVALALAFIAVCASGWAHPGALLAGLVVLPAAVIVEGLRAAR